MPVRRLAKTRAQFIRGEIDFAGYYGQYLTPRVLETVRQFVGSRDHRDIRHPAWDVLNDQMRDCALPLAVYADPWAGRPNGCCWSLSCSVCLARCAAELIFGVDDGAVFSRWPRPNPDTVRAYPPERL